MEEYIELSSFEADNSLLPEEIEEEINKKKVFIDEVTLDVKYFNKEAPVKEISQFIVSEDGTAIEIPKKPLHIRAQQGIKKIFRKRFNDRTLLHWIGKCAVWTAFILALAILGYLIYIFLYSMINRVTTTKPKSS